jgi:hypothetical protein
VKKKKDGPPPVVSPVRRRKEESCLPPVVSPVRSVRTKKKEKKKIEDKNDRIDTAFGAGSVPCHEYPGTG